MLDKGFESRPEALVSSESPNSAVRPKAEDFPGAGGALPVLLLLLLPPVSSLEAAPANADGNKLGDEAFALVLPERPAAPWLHDPPCSGQCMKSVEETVCCWGLHCGN